MPRKTELYLYSHQRELYKKDITNIKKLFFERIYPVFANAEKEAEEYQETLWNNLMEQTYDDEGGIIDPGDFVDSIESEGFNRYAILSLMQYRTIGMWISCMCQVWEQQIFTFVVQEARNNHLKYSESDIKKGFSFTKDVFKYHNQKIEQMSSWNKLKELRLLVNVIKHSEGDSEKRLRKVRPDYFIYNSGTSDIDLLKLYNSSLLEPTIQISTDDFILYHNAILEFWDELPERMISSNEI